MREIKVRVLDEDLITDLVSLLEEVEADLSSMAKHLEDLKAHLEGRVQLTDAKED